jgi:hypothetical protein
MSWLRVSFCIMTVFFCSTTNEVCGFKVLFEQMRVLHLHNDCLFFFKWRSRSRYLIQPAKETPATWSGGRRGALPYDPNYSTHSSVPWWLLATLSQYQTCVTQSTVELLYNKSRLTIKLWEKKNTTAWSRWIASSSGCQRFLQYYLNWEKTLPDLVGCHCSTIEYVT